MQNVSLSSEMPKTINIVKYTKLPENDLSSIILQPRLDYLRPRVRQIVTVDSAITKTTRSLKPILTQFSNSNIKHNKRKVVLMSKDEENKTENEVKRKMHKTNRSVQIVRDEKSLKRVTPKTAKEMRDAAFDAGSESLKEKIVRNKVNTQNTTKFPKTTNGEKKSPKNTGMKQRIVSLRRNILSNITPTQNHKKETSYNGNKKIVNQKLDSNVKVANVNSKISSINNYSKSKAYTPNVKIQNRPITVIHVPLDKEQIAKDLKPNIANVVINRKDNSTYMDKGFNDASIETESSLKTDKSIQIFNNISGQCNVETNTVETIDVSKTLLDDLTVPNISLKTNSQQEIFVCKSLPDLRIPSYNISTSSDKLRNCCATDSFIISRETLTYTTMQKINVKVFGNGKCNELHTTDELFNYPFNIVSVLREEIKNQKIRKIEKTDSAKNIYHSSDEHNSYFLIQSKRLFKMPEILNWSKNNLLFKSSAWDLYQKEWNFIKTFLESLQYLENCFYKNKIFNHHCEFHDKLSAIDCAHSSLVLRSNASVKENAKTMASKSICLLNFLIQHEQKRAQNLLFVLKMREDALKDFTKSHILWLERYKKKQDTTFTSALKKKQRGALIKLQHECGEMQRIRKALITLSERRKNVLMKTKQSIESKLRQNINVCELLARKRKLRMSTDHSSGPLKCLDLSNSQCDDSSSSNVVGNFRMLLPITKSVADSQSVEKCIQTVDFEGAVVNCFGSSSFANESTIRVDGTYLNILFSHVSLPQMFNSGKQYEVNEEAIKSMVDFSNSQNVFSYICDTNKVVNKLKESSPDKSSSPSTARSLVEEMDQYYQELTGNAFCDSQETYDADFFMQEAKLVAEEPPCGLKNEMSFRENDVEKVEAEDNLSLEVDSRKSLDRSDTTLVPELEEQESNVKEATSIAENKPMPHMKTAEFEDYSQYQNGQNDSPLVSPVFDEAEQLRLKQLAIEKEIKALEHQQSLLVVREIPDKPPPPYMPRMEQKCFFSPDGMLEDKIEVHIKDTPTDKELNDAFEIFVKDFCKESLERLKSKRQNKPWDPCEPVPPKAIEKNKNLTNSIARNLNQVLTKITPNSVPGFSARRTDHVDDILFAELRQREQEWTSLHSDEMIVKNQVFESVFRKLLSETVGEYKKSVLSFNKDDSKCMNTQ